MNRPKNSILLAALCCSICSPVSALSPGGAARSLNFAGTCDGSAAAWLGEEYFVNANDEDATLRIYPVAGGSMQPEGRLEMASALAIDPDGEPDIEGGARIGDKIFWITSHALDNDGVIRPERYRLFATALTNVNGKPRLAVTGRVYSSLLKGIVKASEDLPELKSLDFQLKARTAPETPGGLNIEALAEGPDGSLMIGFRAPISETGPMSRRALILPLTNPQELLAAGSKAKPKFKAPIALDLGGRGLRDMTRTANGYILLAGPVDDAKAPGFALYRWSGLKGAAPEQLSVPLGDLRPEALSANSTQLLILSDDGDERLNGAKEKCKKTGETDRHFRGLVIPLADLKP